MLIPISRYSDFKAGDEVILIKDRYTDYAIFCVGHKFKIKEKVKGYGYYKLIDKDGHIIDGYNDDFSLITDIETTKKEWSDFREYNYFKEFMSATGFDHTGVNCPNLDYGFDNRDYISICKLKTESYRGYCIPSTNCGKYLNLKTVTDKRILKFVRKLKINKINK